MTVVRRASEPQLVSSPLAAVSCSPALGSPFRYVQLAAGPKREALYVPNRYPTLVGVTRHTIAGMTSGTRVETANRGIDGAADMHRHRIAGMRRNRLQVPSQPETCCTRQHPHEQEHTGAGVGGVGRNGVLPDMRVAFSM